MAERLTFDLLNDFAHDLKTPLGAVKGFIELIGEAGSLNERQAYFASRAFRSIQRMEQLIAELLDYARLEHDPNLKFDECDLQSLVDQALVVLEHEALQRQITFRVSRLPANARKVYGDARMLMNVISNLLINAIKYNRDGGEVWVDAMTTEGLVCLRVRDNGIGIAPEHLPHIFERFYRVNSQSEGTGLGLAIVERVVSLHHGRVEVMSRVDEGTTFTIYLPHYDPESVTALPTDDGVLSQDAASAPKASLTLTHHEWREPLDDDMDDELQETHDLVENEPKGDEY